MVGSLARSGGMPIGVGVLGVSAMLALNLATGVTGGKGVPGCGLGVRSDAGDSAIESLRARYLRSVGTRSSV